MKQCTECKIKKEDSEFMHRWYVDEDFADGIHNALRKLYSNLADGELITESALLDAFLLEVKDLNEQYLQEEILRRWLSLSKTIAKNPLGEWGQASSSNVKAIQEVLSLNLFVLLVVYLFNISKGNISLNA